MSANRLIGVRSIYRNDGDEMKERFLKPEMEVITFSGEDIITTSGCSGDCGAICTNYCGGYVKTN